LVVNSTDAKNEDKSSDDGSEAAHYRTERDFRAALVPLSSRLFEQMNGQVGGLKFLVDLREDLKTTLEYGSFTTNISVHSICLRVLSVFYFKGTQSFS